MRDEPAEKVLLFRFGASGCALPLEYVIETMRPLAVEPLAGVPPFVRGVAIIRGAATPVIDLQRLLSGGESRQPARFVTIRLGERQAALAVDEVAGLGEIEPQALQDLSPIVANPELESVRALGRLDERLLIVLKGTRIVPEEAWSSIATAAPSA